MNSLDLLRMLIAGNAEMRPGADDALAANRHGMQPFNPETDRPQDVGFGGPSTEYLAGAEDPYGNQFNYPQIWWQDGKPVLLDPDAAYDQSMRWEGATGLMFPRYRSADGAEMAARSRSEQGGAEHKPLAGLYGYRNF